MITGPWKLTDIASIKKNGLRVFSCFHCGGGSTMGYKLAGFDVVGGVEIDPKMMELYRVNHNPAHSFLMGVQEFKNKKDIPEELFGIDVLDGSPPCSSFSMAGSREDAWQEKKKFREGQADQILDDLFFDFIDVARLLKPKVVIAENVKGLTFGNARGYVKQIFRKFKEAGYLAQLFLLNASRMGVPQRRERVFFVAVRDDFHFGNINLEFNEPVISVSKAFEGIDPEGDPMTEIQKGYWMNTGPGKSFASVHPKGHWFTAIKIHPDLPAQTVTASQGNAQMFHWSKPVKLSDAAYVRLQSFPDDYEFLDQSVKYVCGMSVPPLMMQRLALEISKQIFNKS